MIEVGMIRQIQSTGATCKIQLASMVSPAIQERRRKRKRLIDEIRVAVASTMPGIVRKMNPSTNQTERNQESLHCLGNKKLR